MRYPAAITREGKYTYATFVDCPGAMTQADPGESIEAGCGSPRGMAERSASRISIKNQDL